MRFTKKRLTTLLFTSLLFVGCGSSKSDDSNLDIYNGSVPSSGGLIERSTVALTGSDGSPFCTGTIIDEQYVVSAAHCLVGHSGALYVAFGQSSKDFKFVKASWYKTHANYDPNFRITVPADISVVKLSQSVPSGYVPVDIHYGALSRGDTVYLAGFGQTERGSSGRLYYRGVTVEGQTSDEISVSTGACYGDSGGPAYVFDGDKLKVVGATSRASSTQLLCNGGAIYTSLPYFSSWLSNLSGLDL